MTSIDKVSVKYSIDEDRACTFFGNNITVTFDAMNIETTDGDLVEITGDSSNAVGDGERLEHTMYRPLLTTTAWEIQKGVLRPDRKAKFVTQTAPDTLKFEYTVERGDSTKKLEYVNSDSLALSLRANGNMRILNDDDTNTVTNPILPPPGFAGDWERGLGSSLSKSSALEIDVTPPIITSVTSPHQDGTFGEGEEILIHLYFSQSIVVSGVPILILRTGPMDRSVPFNQVVADTIAEFKYIVQATDMSPDLTYTGITALLLNGGSIKRKSTIPTTDAVLLLPEIGESGSLSVNKNIVIDTSNPKILSVTTTARDGTYTAGDKIPVLITFDTPVVVTGTPQVLLNTGSVDLFPGQFVLQAPTRTSAKTIVFPSEFLELSTAFSKGLQFKVDDQVFTVESIDNDEVTLVETYTATRVDPADLALRANLPVYSPGYRPARYVSGSGTKVLAFSYTVQIGDNSPRLTYLSTLALQVGAGSIKRLATIPSTNADVRLPSPGALGSLSASALLVINTDAPRVTQVKAVTRDGVYKAGDVIDIEVKFDLPVVVSSVASLLTNVASAGIERYAYFSDGNGTASLMFEYDCLDADQVNALDYMDTDSLRPAYGTTLGWIRRKSTVPMLPALLKLPLAGFLTKNILINQDCERVTDVFTTHDEGTYGVGESIDILVEYSAGVTVDVTGGIPTLSLTTGANAMYQSIQGTKTLVFNYVVQQSDLSGQVGYVNEYAMNPNGALIKSLATFALSSTLLPLLESSQLYTKDALFVSTNAPAVTRVSTRTPDQVITVGDTIVVSVRLDSAIYVPPISAGTGVPALLLSAGTDGGISSSFVAVEDRTIFFSFTVADGQSTKKLAYSGRSALKCIDGNVLNKDPGQNAGPPTAAFLGDLFVTSWAEMSMTTNTWQVRVKSFDMQHFPPASSFEDGGGVSSGVNYATAMDAKAPNLVVYLSRLYLVWEEASTATNNPTHIRVAVLSSRSSVTLAAQWTFVDAKPPTNLGINKVPTANAAKPHAIVHNANLFVAWHEDQTVSQVRIAVFNGLETAPAWTFIDGNQNGRGINHAVAQPAQNVRLCSCASKDSASNLLYAVWSEMAAATGTAQIRVAVQTGTYALPAWIFIDGNALTGLNVDTHRNANFPSIECIGSAHVVVGWQETSGTSDSLLFTSKFNGDLQMPQWTQLNGGRALNYNAVQPAQNLQLSVQSIGNSETLFATWDELDGTGTATQIRVAKLLIDASPSWKFLDGGTKTSALNDDKALAASHSTLAFSQSRDLVIAVWSEKHTSGKAHVRASALDATVREWMPLAQGCILRKSTTSSTSANLLLPTLNTPGSLDFSHSIQVETSEPTVKNVSLAGDIYSSITAVNTLQTIDVFNVASITQGEYKLLYGTASESSCISWNAPATGLGSIQSALQSITGLALKVSVTQDLSAFKDGHRYTIAFLFPSMGILPLQVKTSPDTECQAFTCSSPTSSNYPCNIDLVQLNQNVDIRASAGVVDAVVRFSFPVVPTGNPKLRLNVGATGSDAIYTTRSALQEFDVGVDAASPVLSGGFRLSYGDFSSGVGVGPIFTTDCIQLYQHDEDGVQEMWSKLQDIAAINTIGIYAISRRRLHNGYRYTVELRNSGDLLDLIPADSSACPAITGATQTIDITASSDVLTGEIKVQSGNHESTCIPWNIRAKGSVNSMEAILKNIDSDRIIALQAEQDPSAYVHGIRFYITFANQTDAQQPLKASTDAGCVAFTCKQANGAAGTCTGLSVNSNAGFQVTRAASEVVSFRYEVQSSDEATFLTYRSTTALTGTFLRASKSPNLAASLTLPTPPLALVAQDGVTSLALIKSESVPVVTRVYSTTVDDVYTAGDVILVLIEFSKAVLVENTPVLELNSNGEAIYMFGSGTNVLHFYHRIQSGEMATALNYASKYSLQSYTASVFKIRCAQCSNSGFLADTTLPALTSVASLAGSSNLVVDTTLPVISFISSSRPNTATGGVGYGPGDIIDIIVTFSTDVAVIGSPSLALSSGGIASFTYGGYRQVLDVGVSAVIPVTSGQFVVKYDEKVSGCIDFDDADSTAASSFKSRLLEIDAVARFGIVSVTKTKTKNGNRFVVLFDSTNVVDVPIAIEIAFSDMCEPLQPSSDAQEALVSRSTDNKLVFHYLVGIGESAAVLGVVGTTISLHAGTASILRQASSPLLVADMTLPAPTALESLAQSKTLRIDGTPAAVSDVVCDTAPGTYGVGFPAIASPLIVAPGEILFHLVFTRSVVVFGTPTLEIATGSLSPSGAFTPNRFANFVGQPQPDQVAFLYHIESGDSSPNLAFSSLNVLSDATIYSASSTLSVRSSLVLPRLTISNSVVKVDAYTVPTAIALASSHDDGVYGAGESIEIHVTFSKPVVLQSGLNRNQDWHARHPVALEYMSSIYVMWTEQDALHNPTQSALYLRVFSSETMEVVPIASLAPINRVPNTLVGKVAMAVWKDKLYAAWNEENLIVCAQFDSLSSTSPWTLIPNMGINKNMGMKASDPVLLVYNLELIVVWREMAVPVASSVQIGQIRVAVFNNDINAPLWIFHDGNELHAGLNRNKKMDTNDPVAVVYRGKMFVAWTESNAHSAYEIVIARRNIQTRDYSTWTYLNALPSACLADPFLSAYNPQFAVRRRGYEDLALLISWHRDTAVTNVSEVVTCQVLDVDWETSVTGSISQPTRPAQGGTRSIPHSIKPNLVSCGDNVYASWLSLVETHDVSAAFNVKMATLPSAAHVDTKWSQIVNGRSLNHNPRRDAVDASLVCSTSLDGKAQAGLVWTEYDGYSIKLRFRHATLVPQPPDLSSSFGETMAGAPILMLATHSTPLGYAANIDLSGLTTSRLAFTYIVEPGHSSPKLDVAGQDALRLNEAVIRDILGNDPDLTLFPNTANARSLSHNSNLIIDTTPPAVLHVTTPSPSGDYGVGQDFELLVTFSSPVAVIKGDGATPPTLLLHSDEFHEDLSSQGVATYTGGSGSTALTFKYTTSPHDYCDTLDYMNTVSLVLNGRSWAIKRNATRPQTNADLTLPPVKSMSSLSGSRALAIKPTQPRVVALTSSVPDGTYYPGDIILIDVLFSLPVVVFGSPVLLLETGSAAPTQALLDSGNGTTTLTFVYTVQIGESSILLDVADDRGKDAQAHFVQSLVRTGSSEIKRLSTHPFTNAVLALPAPQRTGSLSASKRISIDSTPPTVIDIQSPLVDGTYDVGQRIDLLLIFSRDVVVTGVLEIILNVPSESRRTARYADGSGTNTLRFTYLPQEGDNSGPMALDIFDEDSLLLLPLWGGKELLETPAQILCRSLNPILYAELKLPLPVAAVRAGAARSLTGNNRKIFVRTDGFRVAVITFNVPSGTYSPGQRLVLSVLFTGTTVVQGHPRLKLNVNTATYADYIEGTNTSVLHFEYIVLLGDHCAKLEAASQSALELNGGSITDTNGINVPLSLKFPAVSSTLSTTAQIEISSDPPIVQRVDCADGDYGAGDSLSIAVVFSREIVVLNSSLADLPSLLLQFDASTRAATYLSGNKTTTLVFTHQILSGEASNSLDYASRNALTGTILALSTTPTLAANVELPLPGNEGSLAHSCHVRVISTPPVVVDVQAVSRDGTYAQYDTIRLQVQFSYSVFVSPTQPCTLELAIGDVELWSASYVGGSFTNVLEFEYVVQPGDHSARLDYAQANSLQCLLFQSTSSPSLQATTTLPLPGALYSLSSNSVLEIDAFAPRVTSVASNTTNGVYGAGQIIDITITFSEVVLVPSQCGLRLRLAIASNKPANQRLIEPYALYTSGSSTRVLTFAYTTRVGDRALPLEYAGIDALSLSSQEAFLTVGGDQKTYRRASMRIPIPGTTGSLSKNCDIHIDALEPPRVISVGSPMTDGVYTAGDILTLSVTFSVPVTVDGPKPTLLLDTGNVNTVDMDKKAYYVSGSGTEVLLFEYTVQIGDHTDRLEYRSCPLMERSTPRHRNWNKWVACSSAANALQLGEVGSSIKRSSDNPITDAVLDLPPVKRGSTSSDLTQIKLTTGIAKNDQLQAPVRRNKVSFLHQRTAFNIYSNGIPNHATHLLTRTHEQNYFVKLQRFSTQRTRALRVSQAPDAFIGIFLNGILFKITNKSVQSIDECGGAIDADGRYFYINLPTCYLASIRNDVDSVPSSVTKPKSVIVAYALDGFPIYDFYDENGEIPTDLDECHGRLQPNGLYGYHLAPPQTLASPFMPCLKGFNATSQLAVFRYPANISAVEGLSAYALADFDNFVIDKDSALLRVDLWPYTDVEVTYTSTSVIVRSTGVPPTTSSYGPFPNAYNRFRVYEQDYAFQFPRNPAVAPNSTSLPRDQPIGVMINGVPFYAAISDVYGGTVIESTNSAYELLDKCNGLVDAGGDYRYYASPDCLLHELGDEAGKPSRVIGFAFDGYPLYGPYDENGQIPDALDACNGRIGEDGTYRYHVTFQAPYLLGCFRGSPAADQKALDAESELYQSLSYSHALKINTDRPQVAHIFTNKRPGSYVTGDSIDVVVEWTTPVQVTTTGGIPSLSIENSSSIATYDAARSSKTQTVFLYVIERNDISLEDFSYDARTTIELNGGRITRMAQFSMLDAALDLIPSDLMDIELIRTKTSGLASKFQLVRDLRVELRGLYHSRAQDLRASIFHGNRKGAIFDTCCAPRDAFGVPNVPIGVVNRARLASEARDPTSGVGWDYTFSDRYGMKNLALDGGATAVQSSISGSCGPMNAIDGIIRGVGTAPQTVARTLPVNEGNASAWWELSFLDSVTVGTVRIWVDQGRASVFALALNLHVDSSDGISAVTGSFTLRFSTFKSQELETELISYNAVAMIADEKASVTALGVGHGESMQAKLLALGKVVPRLYITREPRDAVQSRNGAFTWHITFLDSLQTDKLALTVGVNNVCGGSGIVQLAPPPPLDDDTDPVVYRNEDAFQFSAKESMFPFWVLLFDRLTELDSVETFSDAHDRAIFSYRIDERHANRSVISVVPPPGTKAQYVRCMTDSPRSVLSIVEVEVFAEQTHRLSQYQGGTPVRTAYHPGGVTWSPEEPFQMIFGGMPSEGSWTLAIKDMAGNGSSADTTEPDTSEGGISDWVLYITNQANETMAYFMDFETQLHALPRHGRLLVGLHETERDHLDSDRNGVLDSIEADTYLRRYSPNNYIDLPTNTRNRELREFLLCYAEFEAVPVLHDASERQLRLPSSVCSAECLAALKLDPYFYRGLEGDKALKLLRVVGDRIVKYVPNAGFRGLDAFTFSVAIAGQESRVLGTIQLNVKECEDSKYDCRASPKPQEGRPSI